MTTNTPNAVERAALEHRNALVELLMWDKEVRKAPKNPRAAEMYALAHRAVESKLKAYNSAVRKDLESRVG